MTVATSPRVLRPEDREPAAEVFARAFAVEPGVRAMFPDPAVRARILHLAAVQEVEDAMARASGYGVEVRGELAAIALWDPPGMGARVLSRAAALGRLRRLGLTARHAPHIARLVARHRRDLPALARERRRAIGAASAGPAWHLSFLGTRPELQGHGLARLLLEHVLDRCDADGLPAWLETTDPVNPPIYERFGFRTQAHIARAGWLPGFWIMRREPRGTPAPGASGRG
jgi:GNAT superfamily N-acetyltransferase